MSRSLKQGQTLFFLGDHTSPGDLGYVRIVSDVLARFHSRLGLRLISAGAPGQTAGGLASSRLLEIIGSSRPDWLVVAIGMADALREPAARPILHELERLGETTLPDEAESVFGPELRPLATHGPVNDVGRANEPELEGVAAFRSALARAASSFAGAGIDVALVTVAPVGASLSSPLNMILRQYSRAIRDVAGETHSLLIDAERACKDVMERASTYKQQVALAGPTGRLNAQGEALLARTVLGAFGVLPSPGSRPLS